MRQIGTTGDGPAAQRFGAFLVTRGIDAHVEEEGDTWALWVRDENKVTEAKNLFEEFQQDPHNARYQGAERQANEIVREELRKREQARKNVVEMRGRWRRPGSRRRPLTVVIITLAVLVALLSNFGRQINGATFRSLHLWDPVAHDSSEMTERTDRLVDVRRGQVWRLLTPIFLHFGVAHLAFNMYMLYLLGGLLEDVKGTAFFALLVVLFAVTSNLGSLAHEPGRLFVSGGMSGVLYGVFGYMWIKSSFDPASAIRLPPSTIYILVGWFMLGAFGLLEQFFGLTVDNWAHGIGLAMGIVVGYAPLVWKSRPSKK